MDETLLLRIRTETLRANLDKLSDFLRKAPTRQEHLHSLNGRLTEIWELSTRIKEDVQSWENKADDEKPLEPESLWEAQKRISSLRDQVKGARRDVEEIQQMSFRVDDPIGLEISKCLRNQIQGPRFQLKQLKDGLENKLPINAADWSDFRTNAVERSQSIFNEYIDLLGGIALRDARFDAGIWQVADELIHTYQKPNSEDGHPLRAIPAVREETVMTLARIIRLRFQDWTIWALPFTAHEFWNIGGRQHFHDSLASEIALITKKPAPASKIEPHLQKCLADAFATYTMGPAYAYAAIILLLKPYDPFVRGAEQPADDVRAHVILKMLEHMDSKSSKLDPLYAEVRTHLKAEWQAAISQNGSVASDEERQQISADTERSDTLVQALWNVLDEYTGTLLTVEAWNIVRSWKKDLLEGREPTLPTGAELRHALNAAWLARVDLARDPKMDLTEAALGLASKIIELKKKSIAGTRGASRKPHRVIYESD